MDRAELERQIAAAEAGEASCLNPQVLSAIESLQEAMNAAAQPANQNKLRVHFDDQFISVLGDWGDGDPATEYHLDDANCWCQPITIEVHETRTAKEIIIDYFMTNNGETLT